MTVESLKAAAALPEIFLALAACVILLVGVYGGNKKNGGNNSGAICSRLGIAALVVTALLVGVNFSGGLAGGGLAGGVAAPAVAAFNNMFIADPLARLLKIAVCLLSAGAFIYSRRYNRERGIFTGEYYVLGLFAVTGMMVMASSNHLLTLYLGLELMSLCLYAMIACYRDDKLATEAAMKYFVLGALASSMLLYGMSLLYGLTGSLELSTISSTLGAADRDNAAVALAVVFIVVALAFKLGAVPFHMWVPDVYHGSPTSTTAFLGAAPKIAAFALMIRLLAGRARRPVRHVAADAPHPRHPVGGGGQHHRHRPEQPQTDAGVFHHFPYGIFPVRHGERRRRGLQRRAFYVLIYAVMSLGAFGAILCLARAGYESDRLDDLKGLSARNPWMAFLILILMLSMAGIPPTAGFFAKLIVVQSVDWGGAVVGGGGGGVAGGHRSVLLPADNQTDVFRRARRRRRCARGRAADRRPGGCAAVAVVQCAGHHRHFALD